MSAPARIFHFPQLSDLWWEHRQGLPTASNFSKIITSTGRFSGQADAYISELIADRACLNPKYFTQQGRPINKWAIQNGHDTEPEARRWYEFDRSVKVEQVGMIITADGRFEGSPDGLIGDDGGLELKCPLLKTHAGYLAKGVLPAEYKAQVHGNLIVSGRKWWDFMSYAQGLDPLIIRVEPDEFTDKLRVALELFWTQYMETCNRLGIGPMPLQIWRECWSKNPSIELINSWLPELASLKYEDKAKVWQLCKEESSQRGWMFDPDRKIFVQSEAA